MKGLKDKITEWHYENNRQVENRVTVYELITATKGGFVTFENAIRNANEPSLCFDQEVMSLFEKEVLGTQKEISTILLSCLRTIYEKNKLKALAWQEAKASFPISGEE